MPETEEYRRRTSTGDKQLVDGISTIIDGPTLWGSEVRVPYRTMYDGQKVLREWVMLGMAFLPYCIKCKVPLQWVFGDPKQIYQCPECGRTWIRGNGWDKRSRRADSK